MSFFTRKPNPPTPPAASRALQPNAAPFATPIPAGNIPGPANSGGTYNIPTQDTEQAPSNARFRSFAERYIVERCRDWKEGEIDERTWEAILQAKSIYNKVREVSRTLGSDV